MSSEHNFVSAGDYRSAAFGGLAGILGGAAFGGFIAWWFGKDFDGVAAVLVFHGAFAGMAMCAWVFPTLRPSSPTTAAAVSQPDEELGER
jgi:hypothetical protein